MSNVGNTNWFQRVAQGLVGGAQAFLKTGEAMVGATLTPVTSSGFYRTPQSAVAMEIVSTEAADAVGGLGATELEIEGLDDAYQPVTLLVATNGTTPVALPTDLLRVTSFGVSRSGTYAGTGVGSHQGALTLREAGGGQIWSEIQTDPHPMGVALIGCHTIPDGKTGFLLSLEGGADSTKVIDLVASVRTRAADAAPYGARRTGLRRFGITGMFSIRPRVPFGPFLGPADVFVLAQTSVGQGEIAADLEIVTYDTP